MGTGIRAQRAGQRLDSSRRQLLHKLPMNVARRRVEQSSRCVGKAKFKWIPLQHQHQLWLQLLLRLHSWTATTIDVDVDVDGDGVDSFRLSRQCAETTQSHRV